MPVYFIPHGGGPCFFMGEDGGPPPLWRNMADFLSGIITSLEVRPRALLIVSSHWETDVPTVHAGERPDLLFDYYGFPEHTYRLRWDAPGAPDVAAEAAALLRKAGLAAATETERGWDHGVFVPMMLAVPGADIATAEISLCRSLDPALHLEIGRALAPLREQGVLIIGSGLSVHNMRDAGPAVVDRASSFADALSAVVTAADPRDRDAGLTRWEALPNARFAHPREEHLLPLMVAAGAAGSDRGVVVYREQMMGWTYEGYRFG